MCVPVSAGVGIITCGKDAVTAGVRAASGAAVDGVGGGLAGMMRDGAEEVFKATFAWWIDTPAQNLTTQPAVASIRGWLLPLTLAVALAGLILQGIRLMATRRADPLVGIGRGFAAYAIVSTAAVALVNLAYQGGDEFSRWVLDRSAGDEAAARVVALAALPTITSPGLAVVLGLLLILAGLVQAVLMMFRDAAVVVLVGGLLLAAAGQFGVATRSWLPRVAGWCAALIAFKPAAAMAYAAALEMAGTATDTRGVITGVAMILLALVALPVLMKLFGWATVHAVERASGAAGLATVVGVAAAVQAAAAWRSSGRAARDQAHHITATYGPPVAPAGPPAPAGASPFGATVQAAWRAAQAATQAGGRAMNDHDKGNRGTNR